MMRVPPRWLFSYFAILIAVLGGIDAYRVLHQPGAAPTPPKPPAQQPIAGTGTSKCFAGDKLVVGFVPFEPLLTAAAQQPGGFIKTVAERVLRDVGCEAIEWRPLTDDATIDVVAAPPMQIEALAKSGKWPTTKDYAVANLQFVKNRNVEVDPKSLIVIDQQWFGLINGDARYPNAQPVPDAIAAFVGKRPRAAITALSGAGVIDRNKYEGDPMPPIHFALAVAKKHEAFLGTINGVISTDKAFIESIARSEPQLAAVRAAD